MADAEFEDLQDAVRHRYDLEGLVGRGGMGAVYRARHVSLDSPVAIKVLPIPASLGAEELARFRREAMLAARLPNPHIVPVFEFEIRGDLAYLVMPLVDGVSLAQRLAQDGALSLTDAMALATQIGGALAFAHERGIIHRDVKPGNILWEPANKRWLITDFGIARRVDRSHDDITGVGAVLGTPAYMAPEQAAGTDLDKRADLYALAATVCEALMGARLKPLTDRPQAEAALRAARPDLPVRTIEALVAPLALNPDQRPPTVSAWLAKLEAGNGPARSRFAITAGAIAALVTVLAVTALLLTPTTPTAAEREIIAVLGFHDPANLGLGRTLASAFEEDLSWVPGVQVVPAGAVASTVGSRDQSTAAARDSAAALVAERFQASGVILGTVEPDEGGALRLTVQVRRHNAPPTALPTQRGPADSLRAMVASVVLGLFDIAGDAPYRPSRPGGGMAALAALLAGDSLFRRSFYDEAIAQYDRVLALDSTYALGAFKRMLAEVMRAQPTRASRGVRSALATVRRYREHLDPLNRDLLAVYEVLLTDGDIERAHGLAADLTHRYPLAVDPWFVKGYLEFYFGPLFYTQPRAARIALQQVADLDPSFAVVHGLLAFVAITENDDSRAREHLRTFLSLDSTSSWADAARLADSVRFRGGRAAMSVLRGLESRSNTTLELIALTGKNLQVRQDERVIVEDAARILRDRATSGEERAVAFRLLLGNALGAGRAEAIDTILREAQGRSVPRAELDRAALLLAVLDLPPTPFDDDALTAAAGRLEADSVSADGPWLAARWFRDRDPARERRARRTLRTMAGGSGGGGLLARSLLADLAASDTLARGDTASAYRLWESATKHLQLEEVPFGLVASLWPLRLAWARVAAARADHAEVLLATATFEQTPGFMDQAGRIAAIPLRAAALDASGDRLAGQDLRRRYARALAQASGPWAAVRDSLFALSGGP